MNYVELGAVSLLVNLLPLPWRLRLLWLRFVYFLTVKITLLLPSTLDFAQAQNATYKMGKQKGEDYESMVQLEEVLEYIELAGIPIQQLTEALERAEAKSTPPEQLGAFIARAILDPLTAEWLLKASLRSTRY